MGAGKQRRGRGTFRTVEDAKKALLRVCGFNEDLPDNNVTLYFGCDKLNFFSIIFLGTII